MSTSLATLIRLRVIQNKTRLLFEGMSDLHYRLQFHHELSPAGWYLGHGMFIENYWLHETIGNDNQYTKDSSLYIPQNCPVAQRGPRLPPLKTLLDKIQRQQDNNDLLLLEKTPPISNHPLFKDEYIENYIIQNYARHYETIHMVLNQIALKNDKGLYTPSHNLQAQVYNRNVSHIEQGVYTIGGEHPVSYDNELPKQNIHLNSYHISHSPVSNGEYLQFIEDGGYMKNDLWSKQGWLWKNKNNIRHPEHWRQNSQDQWYGVNHQGPFDLITCDFIYGLSHYEASAFSRWAHARLPHEHEWETAVRHGQLKDTTKTWEWCENTFSLYHNFKAFPGSKHSYPSPDNSHYVLKGASMFTRPEIKRASFRNFHQAHQRHIFAGLRLVFE